MSLERVLNAANLPSPPTLTEDDVSALENNLRSQKVEVNLGTKVISIHYHEMRPLDSDPRLAVLLLHSGVYTSKIWLETRTLHHLAHWGCRAVAIDLPGKGQSPGPLGEQYWDTFLAGVISGLDLTDLVVVSPSSGGKYAMPYLFKDLNGSNSKSRARGFVPIAPHKTELYKTAYGDNQMPSLILYGANDPKGPETMQDLIGLPNHVVAAIEGAGHPCYAEKAEECHKVLHKWLADLTV